MDNSNLHLVVLAGLLHDIGKAAQRAGRPKSSNLESTYCPSTIAAIRPESMRSIQTISSKTTWYCPLS
jgi:CRISPR/Cas system-associated protein Cas10 (large subunit of type III CRISPR-Cas system)